MRILLRADVENLGHKGDLVEVAGGYARNYLVPRGLAMKATRGAEAQAAAMRRSRDAREARVRQEADELAGRLGASRVEVRARAGAAGKLFGSITSTDIADALRAATGIEVDRRRVELDEPLKEVGSFEVTVRLHAEVAVVLGVDVVAA